MVWASLTGARRISESGETEPQPRRLRTENLLILLRFWGCSKSVYENHPVLHSMETQLKSLRDEYRAQPSEQSRYALVRHEQLLAEWAPLAIRSWDNPM